MSDTPRTDAVLEDKAVRNEDWFGRFDAMWELARQLERQLAAARALLIRLEEQSGLSLMHDDPLRAEVRYHLQQYVPETDFGNILNTLERNEQFTQA